MLAELILDCIMASLIYRFASPIEFFSRYSPFRKKDTYEELEKQVGKLRRNWPRYVAVTKGQALLTGLIRQYGSIC